MGGYTTGIFRVVVDDPLPGVAIASELLTMGESVNVFVTDSPKRTIMGVEYMFAFVQVNIRCPQARRAFGATAQARDGGG